MADLSIRDIKRIARKRWHIFLLSFLFVLLASLSVVYLLPPIYIAASTILVESQQIPEEYVKATVRSYVEERLQLITQQIISRPNLIKIINDNNLYEDMRKKYATEVVIERMRKDINLETISAGDIGGQRRNSSRTVAFKLSYEGKNPDTVQKVANILASLYLEENLRSREEQAARTTDFLTKELDHIRVQINEYENKISKFKKEHMGELPENLNDNVRASDELKRTLGQINLQFLSLKERKVYLEGQLASIEPFLPVTMMKAEEGKSSPAQRLLYLRMQLINLETVLSEKHPDIIRLKSEIRELEQQLGESSLAVKKQREFAALQKRLNLLKDKQGNNHPDVVKLSKEAESLKLEIENLSREGTTTLDSSQERQANPAYISIKAQIDAIDIEAKGLHNQKAKIEADLELYKKRIESTPMIEKAFRDLTMDYNHIRDQYNQIKAKELESNVAKEMEATQHGERFTIIESASKPEKPSKPDRMKLALMCFMLSLGAGTGLVTLRESFDQSIKNENEISGILSLPVFTTIPYLATRKEMRRHRWKLFIVFCVFLLSILSALIIIHVYWMPLEIFWIKVYGKIVMFVRNVMVKM
ncbi:MAG: hypothetical protein JW884_10140 [Deltaproteobacteria bacterium]|nr:hypothetical protein [Deltaproteobacteria bacterium]